MIATPQDLKYSAKTIGRKIKGLSLKIFDKNKKEIEAGRVGQLCMENKWSMGNKNKSWIETGDLGYRDDKGYYFLCGRADEMIVSAGENVYPIEVEQILIKHPQVEDAAVIGISDETFGQRLKAFILLTKNSCLTREELLEWLRSRAARFQIPKDIVFMDNMPCTPLGKLDKKQLKQESNA
jgi:acyl-CoA synthetase (AMP-forming)/AMP-acid ligase II